MILRLPLHVMRPFKVFVVVLRLYRTKACLSRLSVHWSVMCKRQQALLTRLRMLTLSPPPVSGWRFSGVFIIFLTVGGLLMWVRGIHVPSSTSPCAHFSWPMFFCYCYSFFSLSYVVSFAAWLSRF